MTWGASQALTEAETMPAQFDPWSDEQSDPEIHGSPRKTMNSATVIHAL
jgi:hypothetical protein